MDDRSLFNSSKLQIYVPQQTSDGVTELFSGRDDSTGIGSSSKGASIIEQRSVLYFGRSQYAHSSFRHLTYS